MGWDGRCNVDSEKRCRCLRSFLFTNSPPPNPPTNPSPIFPQAQEYRRKLKKEDSIQSNSSFWEEIIASHELAEGGIDLRAHKQVSELLWEGIPSHMRGRVWVGLVGNPLNLTEEVFDELKTVEGEEALASASLDIARTWPRLTALFSEGGAFYDSMLHILSAYAAFRSEIGYVQSMSFVAGMFLLNMEDTHAFICLASVLEKPMMRTFLSMNLEQMQVYVKALDLLVAEFVPKLHEAFVRYNIPHEAYLTDWYGDLKIRAH